jgi:hypothetical protein
MNSPTYNTETFGGENVKFFFFGKGSDSYSITIKVEVSGPSSASLSLCDGASLNSCYELILGSEQNTQIVLKKCKRATPLQCVTMATSVHTTAADIALNTPNFRTFWLRTQLLTSGSLNVSAGSASDNASIAFVDYTPISGSHVGLRNLGYQETIFWRNLRTDRRSQTCTNTFGSYICTDNEEELVAIGYGGISSGNDYRSELTVVSNKKDACSNHLIPVLSPGRYSPGSAIIGSRLFICGGDTVECKYVDINSYAPSWITSTSLPSPARNEFVMLTYLSSFFVIGGSGSSCLNTVLQFDPVGSKFNPKPSLPVALNRHCGVSDPQYKVLWILGGNPGCSTPTDQVLQYNVTQDKWSTHSALPWRTSELSCGIVQKTNGRRWLLVVAAGIGQGSIAYMDLTFYNSTLWTSTASLNGNRVQWRMNMITLTPFSAYLLAGDNQRFGWSLNNFWEFNQQNNVFESGTYYLQMEMYASTWAVTKKSYKALQNCVSYVTYAAVGWGGDHFWGDWDVLLRARTMAGDPKRPARCDNAIPNLLPGKYAPGIAGVGYRLIVCGGYASGSREDATCWWLDTNAQNPVWNRMASMLIPRSSFQLIAYGDAMFAICGLTPESTSQVDRWTFTQGWVNVASYPGINLNRHCAVADEGYDTIYVLGGIICSPGCNSISSAYKYTVSTDTWSSFPSLPLNRHDSACGIINKRTDGHHWMILVGHDMGSEIISYDLTSNAGWSIYASIQTGWARPWWISLTPFESYLAGGRTEAWGASTW